MFGYTMYIMFCLTCLFFILRLRSLQVSYYHGRRDTSNIRFFIGFWFHLACMRWWIDLQHFACQQHLRNCEHPRTVWAYNIHIQKSVAVKWNRGFNNKQSWVGVHEQIEGGNIYWQMNRLFKFILASPARSDSESFVLTCKWFLLYTRVYAKLHKQVE